MNKKTYIYLFIIGTFILWLLLPLFNYTVDRWRVLHNDYKHYYAGQSPNKTFLKTKYLIEHPDKAKTLLMGSSNGGYINANLIKENTYNMKYNFGLLAIHLQNVKTMIQNGVKIKTLWVGINDYIIWKDPKDYEKSFERSTYRANFLSDLKTYMFYLFRKPEIMDWYLYRGKYTLLDSDIISDPKPHLEAKIREEEHRRNLIGWEKHMAEISPTLLHYNDTTYRVNEAIAEISELKTLCKANDINLTLFMYPVFNKVYLAYNQSKVDEFKRKLANVSNYYDFYRLNDNAYDAIKWQDSMHFAYSMGNFIIQSIKENKFLVTKNNVNSHIEDLKKEAILHIMKNHNSMILEMLENKHIVSISKGLTLLGGETLFDLKDMGVSYSKNNDFNIERKMEILTLHVTGRDPIMILDHLETHVKKVFLSLNIISDKKTYFKLYFKKNKLDNYSEDNTYVKILKKGMNRIYLAIPTKFINNNLRINFVTDKGNYQIETFKLLKFTR